MSFFSKILENKKDIRTEIKIYIIQKNILKKI